MTETGPRRRSPRIADKTASPITTTAETGSPVPAGDESITDILGELETPEAASKASASPKASSGKTSHSKRSLDYGKKKNEKKSPKGKISDIIFFSKLKYSPILKTLNVQLKFCFTSTQPGIQYSNVDIEMYMLAFTKLST